MGSYLEESRRLNDEHLQRMRDDSLRWRRECHERHLERMKEIRKNGIRNLLFVTFVVGPVLLVCGVAGILIGKWIVRFLL